jgi:hypothetical protein
MEHSIWMMLPQKECHLDIGDEALDVLIAETRWGREGNHSRFWNAEIGRLDFRRKQNLEVEVRCLPE